MALGGDVDGGVEAEGEVGAGQIVVDGLGDADDFDARSIELLRDRERVVAADGDEGVAPCCFRLLMQRSRPSGVLGGIGARGAQDGAAAGQNAAHRSRSSGMVLSSSRPRQPSIKPTNSSP